APGVDSDLAGGRIEQFQDRRAGGRRAAAAFADEARGLALRDVERDAVARMNLSDGLLQDPFLDPEMLAEVAHRQERGIRDCRITPLHHYDASFDTRRDVAAALLRMRYIVDGMKSISSS